MRTASAITGAAGAYFVVAELSQLGWVASPTFGNAPRTDVLAQRRDGSPIAAIQVKTKRSGSFQIGSKGEERSRQDANEWFVLVSLHGPRKRPDFYVVPRNHIAVIVYSGYQRALHTPGRSGKARQATTMRAIGEWHVARYEERWDLLDKDADDALWMVPKPVWEDAETYPHPEITLGRFAGP